MTTLCESCKFKRFPSVKIKTPEQQIKCEKFKLTSQKTDCKQYLKIEALSRNPLYKKIVKELKQLKKEGKDIYPADIGKKYNKSTQHVTAIIRFIPGVYLSKKCAATKYQYSGSVWKFKEVDE